MALVSPRHLAFTSGFNQSQHSSATLTKSPSPFAESRTPPCSPKSTGQIWDEYERRAREKAKSRETSYAGSHFRALDSQRFSSGTVLDIIKSYHSESYASPKVQASSLVSTPSPSPYLDVDFPDFLSRNPTPPPHTPNSDTACFACAQSPSPLWPACPSCKNQPRAHSDEDNGPHPGPAQRNFASANLTSLPHCERYKITAAPRISPPSPSQPRALMSDPQHQQHQKQEQACHAFPMRSTSLGSAQPPLPYTTPDHQQQQQGRIEKQGSHAQQQHKQQPKRPRNLSLTDPNTPRIRCLARKPLPPLPPPPPPSSQQNRCVSLSCFPSPPDGTGFRSGGSATATATPTKSCISTTSPASFASRTSALHRSPDRSAALASSPPSSRGVGVSFGCTPLDPPSSSPVHCANYSLQQTVSVWEDDDEKANLMDYLRRGLRGSKGSFLSGGGGRRESEQVLLRRKGGKERRGWRGWVNCVSCGWAGGRG